MCGKWSVVTTIFVPSKAVIAAASLSEWCMVIVADIKTPADYMQTSGLDQIPTVVFPTPSMERDMASEVAGDTFVKMTHRMPWNHFARKNIGYICLRHSPRGEVHLRLR